MSLMKSSEVLIIKYCLNFVHLYTLLLTPHNPKMAIINYNNCIYYDLHFDFNIYFTPVSTK